MWLDEFNLALDQRELPIQFFFRNDDAGWADYRLFKLLDSFSKFEIPIDLAVIPQAISSQDKELYERVRASHGLIGVHQHGFSHNNHQIQGRKCEFGSDRSYTQQYLDIKLGKEMLIDHFGEQVDSIFTPPWNRCNQDTVNALIDLGFSTLSIDQTGKKLDYQKLQQLPIDIDWFKKHQGIRMNFIDIGQWIIQVLDKGERVGVMLHHEAMDDTERDVLHQLLEIIYSHPMVECKRMSSL